MQKSAKHPIHQPAASRIELLQARQLAPRHVLEETRQDQHRQHDDEQRERHGALHKDEQLPSPIDTALRICASASGPRIMPTTTGAVGKSKRRISTPSRPMPYSRNRSKELWRMP